MSGTRLTRKVTVEGGKKLPEGGGQSSSSSSGTRRSVFDRLGPGTTERPRVRESFPPEKCRNWLRDGRCQFGRNCKFLHGPFSEPKQRTKSIRSIVRSDVERSEERDESGMGVRTRSLDSIGDDNEEEREIPVKKKKHRPEESLSTGKKSEKAQRRQQEEKGSSEGDQESVEENRKRKKKLKKRSLSGAVVITKPRSPEQEEMDWEDEEYGERRSDMEWEERGELDYERQLNLEKRRQDLQRQLALMDEEEEAAREKSDRKIKEVKKDKGEEQKLFIPVVHSKLHPEKSSVSPGDELSSVSSQSTPKKKKKKTEGELKKAKTKRKLSPSEKELKKRKSAKPVAESAETDIIDERRRKIPSELSPEAPKLPLARTQRQIEISEEEKPRGVKKKQSKIKTKDASGARSGTEAHTIPSDATVRRPQRSPPEKIIPRDKRSYSPEEQKAPVDKGRRRVALSSPEGSDSPALQYPREERSRGVTDSSDGSPRKSVGDIHVTVPHVEADYKLAGKGYERRSRGQESPVISDRERELRPKTGKDVRRVEEERTPRRKVLASDQPPRSPSPAEIPLTGPITPPTEQRRQRSPPRGDRRGPQTPPGEPEFDNDGPKHVSNERAPPRRRGPYTPPHPTTPPVRGRTEKNREEFYEGRSKPVSHRDGMPRAKERDERDRYPKPRDEERGDEAPRGGRGHPIMDEELSRTRVRDEEPGRGRNRDDRQEDYHQRGRAKDDRADEFPRVRDREPERGEDHHRVGHEDTRSDEFSRRKPEGEDEFLRRRDERDDELSRVRNRDLEREDERQRRKDEHQRGRARDEPEEDFQRSRGRDVPRRQVEGGDERYWEAPRGERDFRDGQFAGRDKRRPDIPRQEFPDISRGRERPGERPRDRDGRHPPPGPEYHRRGPSPTPHGPPRRSPPPHGPPRGPHRFMERRRSLSPGGRRDEGYRQGPPREGGYGMGREPIPGRGGYPAPFDERGRPLDSRRRNSPPPRQCAERGRGAPRMRGGRGDRGFPERVRPPGDRYQEPPRDRGGPWESEGRREREHPRDRNRPPHESRDRERKPRGELSPGRGPKQWEERKGGSPGRAVSPPHERRVHEQEKIPRDIEEERRRRSADEDEWEYEEDIGQDKGKAPRPHGERKRPRETASAVSTPESYVGGKRRRSETPETEEVVVHEVLEGQEKGDRHDTSVDTGIPESAGTPSKQLTKLKKKKTGKKEGKVMKSEGEGSLEGQGPQGSGLEKEASTEGEKLLKAEKKHKKEKGKTKEKGTKKKKKNSAALVEAKHEVAKEVTEELTNLPEDESHPSENLGEGTQSSESEPTVKVAKKLRHIDIPEGEEVKGREIVEKPPKKKKKKKHQPELVFQPWADLEGEDEDTKSSKSETKENQEHSKDNQSVSSKNNDQLKLADEKLDSSKADAPVEVFSDWSDDSSIGDDAWSDGNDAREMAEEKPKVDEKEPENVSTPVQNSVPAYDDVYDPISDDELDAMLGEEDDEGRVSKGNSAGPTNTPMPVEDVDWSALVSSQASSEKTGEEPGSHLKRFSPGHVFSRIGISSALAGPRLTKLVQQACAETANDSLSGVETVESNDGDGTSSSHVSFGALMAGAAAKRREREMLFTNVGPCRRALCARKDLGMRKRLRRLTGKIGLFQTPPTAPIDNELYLMSVDLYKHENSSADSSVAKLIPSRVGSVLSTVTS